MRQLPPNRLPLPAPASGRRFLARLPAEWCVDASPTKVIFVSASRHFRFRAAPAPHSAEFVYVEQLNPPVIRGSTIAVAESLTRAKWLSPPESRGERLNPNLWLWAPFHNTLSLEGKNVHVMSRIGGGVPPLCALPLAFI